MAGSMTVVESCIAPVPEAISFPVLTYTDAQPRDFHSLNTKHARRGHNGKIMQWDFSRPPFGDARSNRKPPPGASATFDFQLTAPPDEVIPSNTPEYSPVGPHIIGIALGSPSMLHSQENLPPPRFETSFLEKDQSEEPQPSKSNKWKKIGGFFRAKNALTLPVDQTRTERPRQTITKARPMPKGSKTLPQRETEDWPKLETDKPRFKNFSALDRKEPPQKPVDGLMLDVNIPDVQMERYSVMFGNVMDRNQRPSLLARRSKTLDSLRIPNTQDFLAPKLPPVPQRRATSPAGSSFTVFPTSQPPKAAQILGTDSISRGSSPRLRSNTLPVESPSPSPLRNRTIHNNNSLPSFESPVIPNIFSEQSDTPRSSNTYTRKEDKPLPALKPEPPTLLQSQTPSPNAVMARHSPRPTAQSTNGELATRRRLRPNLTVQTDDQAPVPPAKDKPSSQPSAKVIMSGVPLAISPDPSSDHKAKLGQTTVPIVTEREIDPKEKSPQVPMIEVSIARSISVSKGKRQMLVPIGSRMAQFGTNERFVDRKALIPRVADAQFGHRHAISQELQIESL